MRPSFPALVAGSLLCTTTLGSAACQDEPATVAVVVATAAPAPSAGEAVAEPEPAVPEVETRLADRDPFFSAFVHDDEDPLDPRLPPLARMELASLSLVGVVSGVATPVALLEDKQGIGYRARVGDPIGREGGVVKAIDARGLVVEERLRDPLLGVRRMTRTLEMKRDTL